MWPIASKNHRVASTGLSNTLNSATDESYHLLRTISCCQGELAVQNLLLNKQCFTEPEAILNDSLICDLAYNCFKIIWALNKDTNLSKQELVGANPSVAAWASQKPAELKRCTSTLYWAQDKVLQNLSVKRCHHMDFFRWINKKTGYPSFRITVASTKSEKNTSNFPFPD